MRGSIFDSMTFFVLLLVFATTSFVAVYLLNALNTGMVDSGLIDGVGADIMIDNDNRSSSLFDGAIITLLIVSWVYMLISGYLLFTQPAFMIVGFIFSVIILIFIGPISNVFLSVTGQSEFSAIADSMPITMFLFNNAVIIIAVMLVSVLIATYAGYRGQGGVAL